MKRILSTLTLLLCFAFTAVNAQGTYDQATMGAKVVEMETANWGQNSPFNKYCVTSTGATAKTGCVPTAFAIVMRYHGFPEAGIGTLYNQQTVEEFTNRTYDWNNMPLTYSNSWTDEQIDQVSKLMHHLGHAFGVTYGQGETSVSIGNTMSEKMRDYFNYNYAAVSNQYNGGSMYNFETWKNNLKASLLNGCPVPYAANNKGGTGDTRHMFVVDGYTENDYFHFNFGWNGSDNGWYKLENITPAGSNYSWLDSGDGYDSKHQAYFNLTPNKTTYPVTATATPSNMGTVSINGGTAGSTATANLFEGVTATLTAYPAEGYALASWTKNGVVVGSKNTLQVTVGTDANDYVANFDDAANVLVEKDCTFNISSVEISGANGNYCSTWTTSDGIVLSCTKGAEPAYALSPTVNTFFAKATVGNSETLVTDITYTLTAPAGYIIKSYSFKGKSPSSSYTIDVTVGGNTTNVTNASAGVVISASDINAQSTSFVLSSTYAGRAGLAILENGVTVTIQSEGGGSTPTPDPEPEPDPIPTTYAVTTTANPAAGGTAKFAVGTGSQKTQGDVENGTQITLYATANTGYNFINWTLGGNVVSTDATCNVSVAQASNYVANFEAEANEPAQNDNRTIVGVNRVPTTKFDLSQGLETGYYLLKQVNDNASAAGGYGVGWIKAASETVGASATSKNTGTPSATDNTYIWYVEVVDAANKTITISTANKVASWDTPYQRAKNLVAYSNKPTLKYHTGTVNLSGNATPKDGSCFISNEGATAYVHFSGDVLGSWNDTNQNSMFMVEFYKLNNEDLVRKNNFTIAVTAGNGGTATASAATVVEGNNVTLTATANSGYSFVGWYDGETKVSEANPYTFAVTSDINYEARFEVNEKTLNVTFSGATWGNASDGYYDYVTTNTDPVVTVRTANGGKAIGYSTINSIKQPYLLHNNNFTISIPAPYKIIGYTLTYKGHLFASGKTFSYTTAQGLASETIQNDTEKNLIVTGLENSEIAINVSDNSSKAGVIITALEITYVEDTNLETYTVAVAAGENGTATASAATVVEGDNVTLTATANTDYKFVGWYNGETKVSEANPYTFAVTSNISYEARFEELFPDGAYKVYWQADNRGYLAYHGTDYPNEAKLAGVTYSGCQNLHYGINDAALVWYLITASDGKRYLFEVATGKFLGVNTSVYDNGQANKLSTTEAWPIAVEPNTNSTRLGHYIITTMISGTKNLLCSGCGTPKEQHPVRWLVVNDNNQKDGGAPLQLVKVDNVTVDDNVMRAVRAVIEPRTFKFKAEIENWRNDNPNTHLGTITIGGTPLKLTPEHLDVSELTMALNEGTTLAFTRKYRGFEFNGFYIGATELGENPTLTAENVAAIDENNPLIAKFTATDDVTLFYDDDEFSYRIPAIAKTGTNRLVAISDYRHSHDDIGRDNHNTGTLQVDLVMRTSEDNGLTWSAKQTIAEGNQNFGYGDAAVVANGQNILVMAVAGNVFFTNATSSNKQRTYRIYSADNGVTWEKEEVSSNLYTLFPNANGMFFGSGKLVVDPNFNNSGNARVYGAVLLNDGNNYVVYSDNWGSTWNILGGGAAASANEPKVEILPNGQILLSSRRGGGRTFNVFTYTDKANNTGTWSTSATGCDNGGNATNGEIICLDAKRPNGQATKILLQSQPNGSDRRNVSIWYKEISADETYTGTSIASDWTMGKQVSTQLSAYSAMCLQANGEIALFFEEAPCHNDDATYGYSMVYVPLTIEEITNNNFLNPNAVVETKTVDVTLTDNEGNIYTHQFDYLPGDAAAIDAALMSAYPFITELGEGNLQGSDTYYTYTNTVTLPFKVSNAETTAWYNIYYPSNASGNPNYIAALNEDAVVDMAASKDFAYGANPTYNTKKGNNKISWAIYNVNDSFEFIFKNELTCKYIKVESVSNSTTQNVKFVENAENATAFTLLKDTGTRNGDYALVANIEETRGYLCATSSSTNYVTHFEHTNHEGAWVKFVEAPDYQGIYDKLIADINNFGAGEGKYTANNTISSIDKDALATMLYSNLEAKATEVQTVKDSYSEITLTVPVVNDVVPGSVKILGEAVSHKFVPKGEITIQAVPAAGYRFVNWTRPAAAQASAAARTAAARNSNVVSDQNPYTVTVSEALSLEANFEEIVVTAKLKDERENNYNVTLNAFAGEINQANVEAKLLEKYPYIEFGNEAVFNATTNTYSNRIVLPFKVSNLADPSSDNLWHNIYYPSNNKTHSGYPNYIAALNEDEVVDMAASSEYAYGANPTYNTMEGNPNISWAIYNVNDSFEFIFKNELTGKYIKVESVVNATGNTQNVKFVENAKDATAFTLLKDTGSYNGDYALVAKVGDATGYLCATSSNTNYVTHFDSNGHQGAWVKFAEADYEELVTTIGGMLFFFEPGNNKCVQTVEIQAINEAFGTYENPTSGTILLNTLKSGLETIADAIDNWPLISVSATEGGSVTINNESVSGKKAPVGHPLPIVATPAEGYSFVNWTKDAEVVSTDAECTYTVEGATTLTANFAKNSYTVSVTAGEGGSASASAATVEHGNEVTLTAQANSGYEFAGWYDGENLISAEANYTFTVTSDINYTARFEEEADTPVTYTVSIETEGLSNDKFAAFIYTGITQNETQKSYELGSAVKLIAVQDNNDVGSSGYAFVGWFLGETLVSENDEFDFNVTGDVTYKAKFVEGIRVSVRAERGWPSIYLLNSDKEVGGTSMSTLLVPGRQLKLSVNPEFGCRFVRWTVGEEVVSTDNPYITEPLNEAVTFKAICEPASYNLTVRANYDERGTVSATSGTSTGTTIQVGHNMDATITATANTGYRFVNWTKGTDVVSTSATYTIAGIENVEDMLDAEYVAVFEVEESVNPNVGTYYRIGYDGFDAPAAASAARAAATRAVGDVQTYVVNGSTGTAALDSESKTSRWSFIPNGELLAELTLEATANVQTATTPQVVIETKTVKAIKVDGNYLDLCTGGWTDDNKYEPNKVTFTLSVQNSGYQIVGYDIECKGNASIKFVPTGAFLNSNNYQVFGESFTPVTEHSFSFERDIISTITVNSFKVYIQPVGGEGEGEGTPETPEIPGNRYYIQSEACGVANKTNALLMTQETGAASIFYYADNKLMSYAKGTYLNEVKDMNEIAGARGLQGVDVEGGDVEFSGSKIKVVNGTTSTVYLHANQSGTKYFVDRCGTDNCGTPHNFVLEEVTSLPVTISSVGYATWYAPVAVELPDAVTAYTITIDGDYAVTGDGFKTVPAKTGVILAGAPGTYNLEIVTTNEVVESIMEGTVAAEYLENESAYVLSNKGSLGLGFYLAADGNASYSHKAYLPKSALAPAAQMRSGFRLMLPGVTAIEEVETENVETIYDLTGRKLEGISGTGIYIINGKKVLVK